MAKTAGARCTRRTSSPGWRRRIRRSSIIDAAVDLESAVGKLSGVAMGDDARAEKLIRIIGEFMWETRRERGA